VGGKVDRALDTPAEDHEFGPEKEIDGRIFEDKAEK
jgi:hypothetical protein